MRLNNDVELNEKGSNRDTIQYFTNIKDVGRLWFNKFLFENRKKSYISWIFLPIRWRKKKRVEQHISSTLPRGHTFLFFPSTVTVCVHAFHSLKITAKKTVWTHSGNSPFWVEKKTKKRHVYILFVDPFIGSECREHCICDIFSNNKRHANRSKIGNQK